MRNERVTENVEFTRRLFTRQEKLLAGGDGVVIRNASIRERERERGPYNGGRGEKIDRSFFHHIYMIYLRFCA